MSKRSYQGVSHIFATLLALRTIVLLGTPCLAALDYGGVLPWTEWAITLAAVTILILSLPEWLHGRARRPLTTFLTMVALCVALGATLQTYRLPNNIKRVLSPGSSQAYGEGISEALRSEARLSGDPILESLVSTSAPLSVSPARTTAARMMPLLFAAFVIGSACTFHSKGQLLILLFALAGCGCVLSYIGIADQIRPAERLSETRLDQGNGFATFVNRNNAAGYLNLALAGSAGCLIWRYRWQRARRPWDDRFDIATANPLEILLQRLRQLVGYVDTQIILMMIVTLVILLGVFISGSRGGLLGAVAGILVAGTRAVSVRQARSLTLAISAGIILLTLVLGLIGSLDQVRQRTSSIWQDDFSDTARWSHWHDAIVTASMYLPAGAGLGSYRYAYLPYQERSPGSLFEHADNMYLEVLVEGGLWLPLLLILGLAIVLVAVRRLSQVLESTTSAAIVTASGFMLAAMFVSQAFDFGVLLPANYLTVALLVGTLLGYADNPDLLRPSTRKRRRSRLAQASGQEASHSDQCAAEPSSIPEPAPTSNSDEPVAQEGPSGTEDQRSFAAWLGGVGMLDVCTGGAVKLGLTSVLAALLWTSIPEVKGRADVDYWQRFERRLSDQGVSSFQQVLSIQPDLERLSDARPLDAEAQLTLARWQILSARSELVRTSLEQQTPQTTPALAWQNSNPRVLRAVYHTSPKPALDDLAKLGLDSQETEHLRRARSAALQALLANPLDVDSRRLLIELDFLAPSPDADTAMFDQVLRLRCNHASTLHDTAMLAVFSPGKDKAIEFWKRSLAVGPELIDYFWQDASLLIDEVTFSGALPSDPTVGIRFAELAKDSSVRDHVLYCVEQQLRQLNPAVHEIAQHQYNLGRVAELRGKFEAAEVFYALAVESNPSLTDWRFRYANMLQQNGRSEASYEQIKRCLLQSPDNLQFLQKSRELREATR